MFNQMGHTQRADLEQSELPTQGFHLGLEVIAFLNNSNPPGGMFGPFLPIGIGDQDYVAFKFGGEVISLQGDIEPAKPESVGEMRPDRALPGASHRVNQK